VSDWIEVAVAPRITLTASPASPLAVSGTVTPPKAAVTVELRGGSRVLRSKRIVVTAGRFAGAIRTPPPGRYTLIARTAGDQDNVSGASAPVPLTVT
jgi:hypothetical protein